MEIILSEVLDAIGEGIYVLSPSGDPLYVNSAVVDLYGISREKLLSSNIFAMHQEGIIRGSKAPLLKETMELGRKCSQRQRFFTRAHSGKEFLSTQNPVFDAYGNVIYTVGSLRDINEVSQAYRECININSAMIDIRGRTPAEAALIAEDPQSHTLLHKADLIAASDASVLITGESGVGKEVYAEYIHRNSHRSSHKLVKINCASLPETLLEAELFGYVKGAFTGADANGRRGLIEEASGGTLFLDEINSMPLAVQAKFLRVLDGKMVRRIGTNEEKEVDFRLIAATNEDLRSMVKRKQFRQDLYYRCNVIPFQITPLRERRGDIVPLCKFYMDYYNKKYGVHKELSDSVLSQLEQLDWPGNVRELKNLLERLIVLTTSSANHIHKIPSSLFDDPALLPEKGETTVAPENLMAEKGDLKHQCAVFEQQVIERTILECGSISKAAKALGIDRTTLIRKRKGDPRDQY